MTVHGETTVPERLMFAVAMFIGYLLVARAVINAYPASMFDMYALPVAPYAERLAVLSGEQRTALTRWGSWQCDTDPMAANAIPYKREEAQRILAQPADGPEQDVTLVREIWRGADGAWVREDEVIARCRARRR